MYQVAYVRGKGYALYGFEITIQGYRKLSRYYRNFDKFCKHELIPRALYRRNPYAR